MAKTTKTKVLSAASLKLVKGGDDNTFGFSYANHYSGATMLGAGSGTYIPHVGPSGPGGGT